MKKVIAIGVVEKGTLTLNNRERFTAAVAQFDGPVVLTLEREKRTNKQNAMYWLWNTRVAGELGWTAEEVHDFSKAHLNLAHKTMVNPATGEAVDESFPASTASLSIDAFNEYLDRYLQFWAERGIVLDIGGQP